MGRYHFKLPDVGEGSVEAELVAWQVNPGDTIAEGQPVVEVMTEKASIEIPAPTAGTVVSVAGEPGEMLAVGSTILVLDIEGAGNAEADGGEPAAAWAPGQGSAPSQESPSAQVPSSAGSAGPPVGAGNYAFKLPDVGEGSVEAELVAWQVNLGDTVAEGQPVVEVMTEKASIEIPAPTAGTVVWVKGAPGEMLAVGSDILLLQVDGPGNITAASTVGAPTAQPAAETAPAGGAAPPTSGAPVPAPAKAPARVSSSAAETKPGFATRTPGEKPIASPAVRRRAWEQGVALQFVPGSAPGGRITQADLDAYVESGGSIGAGAPVGLRQRTGSEDVKVIGLRRVIAARMQDAKRRIPHFSYIEEIDVTDLEALRVALNAQYAKTRGKLTLLPFLVKAMVRTLPDYPQINARYHDDDGFVRRYDGVHLGIATQTPTGLVVPTVHHAEALTLWECAAEIARLAGAAREGKATRDELSGSTITITSLGALGGLATTPVINYPEVAIVGVNKMIERPVVRDGQVVIRKIMNLSSSFDHRVVDGWDAAEFVQRVRATLETPATLFVEG